MLNKSYLSYLVLGPIFFCSITTFAQIDCENSEADASVCGFHFYFAFITYIFSFICWSSFPVCYAMFQVLIAFFLPHKSFCIPRIFLLSFAVFSTVTRCVFFVPWFGAYPFFLVCSVAILPLAVMSIIIASNISEINFKKVSNLHCEFQSMIIVNWLETHSIRKKSTDTCTHRKRDNLPEKCGKRDVISLQEWLQLHLQKSLLHLK